MDLLIKFLLILASWCIASEVAEEVKRLLLRQRLSLSWHRLIARLLGRLRHAKVERTRLIVLSRLLVGLELSCFLLLTANTSS